MGWGMDKPLSERQRDVLEQLRRLRDRPDQCSRSDGWATPQDFGGHDGSHHWYTAKKLAMLGLIDRHNYHTGKTNHFTGGAKGACRYKITDAGIATLTAKPGAVGA